MNEGDGRPRDRKLYQDPFGNARWSQDIYFKLLECGLRIPPSAGSGSGESPNPVGYNRVYVHLDGDFSYQAWWKNFRAGRVFVTNGPLLRPTVEGEPPGHVFNAEPGTELELEIGLSLSTGDTISYLDIIQNGQAILDPLGPVCQDRPAAKAALQTERLVPHSRRDRRDRHLPVRHDRSLLC